MKLLISPTYLSKRLRNWNNNTIRIIERVCHKCDDMPSFFFRYFSHFCQLTQPLHSANSAISFCKQIRLILLTNSNLRANAVESSSQRSHIWVPAQRYVATLWNVRTHAMKCMVSSAYFKARIYWTVFFFDSVVTSATRTITLWL